VIQVNITCTHDLEEIIKQFCFKLQQLETIQRTIEPLQDAILRLANVAATITEEEALNEIKMSLDEFRRADKELRDRLFVVQVAKKYDWDAANKMARRKAGEYDDPDLTKVLEEREKKEEKAKPSRDKEQLRLSTTPNSKRGRFTGNGTPQFKNGYQNVYSSPLASAYPQEQRPRNGYGYPGSGYRQQPKEEQSCRNCHQKGHFWRQCPNKK
jgi:hypothetical protein